LSDHPIERLAYDFLVESFAALDEEHPFFGADLHRHVYKPFAKDKWFGVRVSNGASDLAPNPGATAMEEFDGRLILVPFARIKKSDHSDLEVAVDKAFALEKWVAQLFDDATGVTMNNRVQDARVLRGVRDFLEFDSALYALANLPLLINDTGSSGG
jgi:hypothetical protein